MTELDKTIAALSRQYDSRAEFAERPIVIKVDAILDAIAFIVVYLAVCGMLEMMS